MANIMTYLDWWGEIPFTQVPFNEVDNLIMTQLCFLDFSDIADNDNEVTLAEAAKKYFQSNVGKKISIGMIIPRQVIDLLRKTALSVRFSDIVLSNYVNIIDNEKMLQFAALTAKLCDNTVAVVFRGTDDTLIGWKEDFHLACQTPVPAQIQAVKYLNSVANETEGDMILMGHSKGGNLAIYSAVHVSDEIRARIRSIYNNDGPGFNDGTLTTDAFLSIQDRVHSFVPQSSFVGMLLDHDSKYDVVKSSQISLLQHDVFSWEVMGGKLLRTEFSPESKRRNDTISALINSMDCEQRTIMVEAFFRAIQSTNATTLTELFEDKTALLKIFRNLSKEDKLIFKDVFRKIREETRKNIFKPKE